MDYLAPRRRLPDRMRLEPSSSIIQPRPLAVRHPMGPVPNYAV